MAAHRFQVTRDRVVNTQRLEQLLTDQEPAVANDRLPALVPQRRSLAISGGREARRLVNGRALSVRNLALIEAAWADLDPLQRDPKPDAKVKQFNVLARDPNVGRLFDVLRAQLVQAFQKRNLRCLGITSPVAGAGASYTTAGLLASFARRKDARVVGLDLNLANPSLHRYFEVLAPGPISAMIEGEIPVESHLQRATASLAIGLNDAAPAAIGAGIDATVFADFMADMVQFLAPDMVICDLPPLLSGDAALALLPSVDAVLVVADARSTQSGHIAQCERILQDQAEFLGVVLNHDTTSQAGR